jgi:hypothetical protein
MLRGKSRFSRSRARPLAKPVDRTSACDRDQPWAEGSAGIISVPNGMNRQQHILDHILDVVPVMTMPQGQHAQKGRYFVEQATISDPVAVLGPRHQDRPIEIAGGERALIAS